MKPHVVMLMESSIDGRLHPSKWTHSPDGDVAAWSRLYEAEHAALDGDAWLVGRVTMAEMSRADAHPPADAGSPVRPVHVAAGAGTLAIALDWSARLHFGRDGVGGDRVLVLLGPDTGDAHLAELAADGVSYVIGDGKAPDLAALLDVVAERFGVRRLLLEGGAGVNGSFLAAGLVDEISLIVAPAIDGDPGRQAIVAVDGGLQGKVALSLVSAQAVDHGAVHLRYRVTAAG